MKGFLTPLQGSIRSLPSNRGLRFACPRLFSESPPGPDLDFFTASEQANPWIGLYDLRIDRLNDGSILVLAAVGSISPAAWSGCGVTRLDLLQSICPPNPGSPVHRQGVCRSGILPQEDCVKILFSLRMAWGLRRVTGPAVEEVGPSIQKFLPKTKP
jgi:hypothetical protein